MKTPKRDYKAYHWLPDCAERPDLHELESIKENTRWKRKNRVRQLKRSLRRYKNGDFLFYREKQAYLLIQKLRKPTKKDNLAAWDKYTFALLEIAEHINIALVDANFKAGICYEKNKH